jgi:hypothetical protein
VGIDLPEAVTRYLDDRDKSAFTDDAVVTDDGHTHTGIAAVEKWLARAASEYTYTVELTGAQRIDAANYLLTTHLEGDFPGGQVDLRHRLTIHDGLIKNLTIEP